MVKSGIDMDALMIQFAQATTQHGETLRKAVGEATLKALQGRELTLANIRKVLEKVTEAASAGLAKNALPGADAQAVLSKAIAGMDGAVLQAVQAHRKALEQFVERGIGLQDEQMKGALANIEKMESMFFKAISGAAKSADDAMRGPWEKALAAMKLQGTATGAQAATTLEQLTAQAETALREGRSASLRSAQALLKGYAALVSGVLIGMTDALQPQAAAAAKAAAPKAAPKKARKKA
jgi:hypothetical protein